MNHQNFEAKLNELKAPKYRFQQAMRAYYKDFLGSWDDISTWPKDLRLECRSLAWSPLKLAETSPDLEFSSIKLLLETEDRHFIETVIIRHQDGRNTVCISSQVGCAMGCGFCATGTLGFTRNLSAEEIVDQVIQAARILNQQEAKVTNIVFMGMGEPFNNPDNVFEALRLLMHPDYFGLGARHISISTCGIIPGIQRLAKEAPQVNLAISLHAPDQLLRAQIMPVAKAYSLDKLMDAVKDYLKRTNRKVMFEYVMLNGVNDGLEQAEKLVKLLGPLKQLAHINLIKYHDTGTFNATDEKRRREFFEHIRKNGLSITQRVSFGEQIKAACGQLAGKNQS